MSKKIWNRRNSIATLNTIIDAQIDGYQYKLARYLNDVTVDLRNSVEYSYGYGLGFDLSVEPDLLRSPTTNVIKSVIDSLVSKLANNKVRPFFTPINTNYKTKQVIRQTQKYFDSFYDNQDIHNKVSLAFKSATIFDKGYLWLNPISYEIEFLPTWCVSTLNSEEAYGDRKPTKMLIKYLNFPTTKLPDYINYSGREYYVDYELYVDIEEHEFVSFINGREVENRKYPADILPLVTIYYNEPVFGNRTVSIVDELDGLQTQIDLINAKISTCSQLTPGNVTYVSSDSSVNGSTLTNRDGAIYRLDMGPTGGQLPVMNVTPAPFDPMWQNMLDFYIQKAYDMVGISQLSAQSKKPSGLDSGAALTTMEDIESDRFEVQTTNYINIYTQLTKIMIAVLPDDAEIMPEGSLTWKEVKEEASLFNIQFSASSALSKDPQTKMQQIMQMSQAGLIPSSKIGQYLELPDLEDAYSGAAAVQNAVDKVIDLCLDSGKIFIPEYVSYELLSQEITQTQNELFGSLTGDKKVDGDTLEKLDNLALLESKLTEIMQSEGFIQNSVADEEQMVSESGISTGGAMAGGIEAPSAAAEIESPNSDMVSTEPSLEATMPV